MPVRDYPWPSRALNLFAPHHDEVDRFCNFIETQLVPDRIDTIVLIVRYNYEFVSHPECRGVFPLSRGDVGKIVETCRKHKIRLVPNMNLLGHQTIQGETEPDGLLKSHPEFSETSIEEKPEYSYSLCPNAPGLYEIVTDLMDELIDVFQPEWFHMGGDEVFYIGMCDRCKDTDPGELFAAWYNRLAAHLKSKGITPMLWGDRLLDSEACHHGPWDASRNGTHTAIKTLDRDIIITDWHYFNWPDGFPSVEVFAREGFKMYLCPFNDLTATKAFMEYARAHDGGNILGVMETTWTPCKWFMDGMEGKPLEDVQWFGSGTPHIVYVYSWLFRPEQFEKMPYLPDEE